MKRIALLMAGVALLAVGAISAFAETATMTISGGALSVTPANVTLSAVTLDGTDQTSTSASASNTWTAVDARGTGVGWNLTILSTDFTSGAKSLDISAADQEFKIQLSDANVTVTAGNTKPTSSVTALTAIPKVTALKFVSAAVNAGMDTYSLAPNFELEVPAETFVSTGTYTATITITAVSAP